MIYLSGGIYTFKKGETSEPEKRTVLFLGVAIYDPFSYRMLGTSILNNPLSRRHE